MPTDWKKSAAVLGFLSTLASAQTARVVTVAVYQCSGSTVGLPSIVSYATNPASSVAAPYTTTIPASGTNPGSVVVVTPTGYTGTLPPYTTIYGSYSGVSVLTADYTYSTAFPAGASQGVYYVYRPGSRYVTLTEYQTGGVPYTQVVTRTIAPSGTMPGYYIIQTPPPSVSNLPSSNPGTPPMYTPPINPISSSTSPGAPPAYNPPTDPVSSTMSSMASSMSSASPSGGGSPPPYDTLPACGETIDCASGATNTTLCNSEYGNAFNTTCGIRYTSSRTPRRTTTNSASVCARECDLSPGCVAYNYMADEDTDNCEILDEVTGTEPSDGSVGATRPTDNPNPINTVAPSSTTAGQPPQYTVPQSPSTTESPLATITPSPPISTGGSVTQGANVTALIPTYNFPGQSPSRSTSVSAPATESIPPLYSEPMMSSSMMSSAVSSASAEVPPFYSAPANSSTPIAANTTSSSSSFSPSRPTQSGIPPNCNLFQLAVSGDFCIQFANDNGITLEQLFNWNPSLGPDGENCNVRFQAGLQYCVGVSGPVSSTGSVRTSTATASNEGLPTYTDPLASTTTTTGVVSDPPPAYTDPTTTTTPTPAPAYVEPAPR